MTRILHIVYSLIRGGTEGQCAQTALWLSERSIDQKMAVFSREGAYVAPIEQRLGLIYQIPIRHILRFTTWQEVERLVAYIRNEAIDIVHTWDADAALFGAVAAYRAGASLITSRRDLGEIYPRWKLRWMKWADQKAARVVVNAEVIRTKLRQEGCAENKVVKIPNLFHLSGFEQQQSRPCSLARDVPKGSWVVMVARLDVEKDVPTLLRAMKWVVGAHPSAQLIIAGDGHQRLALERLSHDLNLGGNVLFLGDVHEVPSLLRQCQVGVLTPCANEGLSNSILEYMAARLPVVATDCGGNAELVEHGKGGYVVPVGDEKAIAQALLQLLKHPEAGRQMGLRGRQRLELEHQPDIVAGQFSALYQEVMEKSKGVI